MGRLGKREKQFFYLFISLLFLGIHYFGYLEPLVTSIGEGGIAQANQKYLAEAESEAIETFLVFTGVKTGISVIQTASVGISFLVDVQVQVGNLLETLRQVVDYGWMASMMSMVAIHSIEVLLSGADYIARPALCVFLIMNSVHFVFMAFFPNLSHYTAKASATLFFIVLLSIVFLPLSIYLSSYASHSITGPIAQELRKEISSEHKDLVVKEESEEGLKSQAKSAITHYSDVSSKTDGKVKHLTKYVVRHISVILFDVLIFPLAFFLSLSVFSKKVIAAFFLKLKAQLLADHVSR